MSFCFKKENAFYVLEKESRKKMQAIKESYARKFFRKKEYEKESKRRKASQKRVLRENKSGGKKNKSESKKRVVRNMRGKKTHLLFHESHYRHSFSLNGWR